MKERCKKYMYITNISISKVRHLKDVEIPLSNTEKKHLIITDKNGSGKTSLLNAISIFLNSITTADDLKESIRLMHYWSDRWDELKKIPESASRDINEAKNICSRFRKK